MVCSGVFLLRVVTNYLIKKKNFKQLSQNLPLTSDVTAFGNSQNSCFAVSVIASAHVRSVWKLFISLYAMQQLKDGLPTDQETRESATNRLTIN